MPGFEDLTDVTYHRAVDQGTVRIAFNRPEVRNAFRPHTVDELLRVPRARPDDLRRRLRAAHRQRPVAQATAAGRSAPAATSGSGAGPATSTPRARPPTTVDRAKLGRLHILECQRLIRFMPKVVICVVPGWAAGGGHSLHVVCRPDARVARARAASSRPTPTSASFDGGFGSAYLARQVGQKFAREIFFLGDEYDAEAAHRMGMVNAVVRTPTSSGWRWSGGARSTRSRPTAQRMLKYAFNLVDDGLVGQQLFAGEATRLAYGTDEAAEGRDSFLEKRDPDWSTFPWYY